MSVQFAVLASGSRGNATLVQAGGAGVLLDLGIGLGYVPATSAAPDSELVIDVRGKPRRARVVKKPIYRKET